MSSFLQFFPFSKKLQFLNNEILLDNSKNIENNFSIKILEIQGLIGQITIQDEIYLLFVEHSRLIFNTNDILVYKIEKIKSVNLSLLRSFCKNLEKFESDEIYELISFQNKELKNFLIFFRESPFYVSKKIIENEKYLWNKFLLDSVENLKNKNGILYMYNGFFEMKACVYFKYYLSSFISSNRVGPRYFSRGIDSDGNVSNFVKTRYFVYKNDEIILDIIIYRGSVPIFWHQSNSLRELEFAKKDNFIACLKHFYQNFRVEEKKELLDLPEMQPSEFPDYKLKFKDSVSHFDNILVIDLLSNKKEEKKLSDFYIELLEILKIQNFTFNLNKYHLNYQKLKTLFLEELHKNVMKIQEKMLLSDNKLNKIIFRVNCLDCLDRTNLASYLICDYYHSQLEIPKDHLKSLFHQNGNILSLFNSGSNALKNELAIKEKRSIKGLMDDFYIFTKRVLHDKFNDKQKMEYIDLLLGKKTKIDEIMEESDIENQFFSIPDHDSKKENFILITMKIHSKKELKNFNFEPPRSTSIVIFCINKITSSLISIFSDEILSYSIKNYRLIFNKNNFNTHILIFCKENLVSNFEFLKFEQKKRNLQFTKKNCSISVLFNFNKKRFNITNMITDKIPTENFDKNIEKIDDIFLITGIFLNQKSVSIFDLLNCNYIETSNNIKVGFKGGVSGKDFQEYDNVNFFTFNI